MRSLGGLGTRNLKHRRGRSAMTALGIVLGVAILFGVLVTNASINRGFDDLVDRFDTTDVMVRASGSWDGAFAHDVITTARALPDVKRANGYYGFGAGLKVDGKPTPQPVFVAGNDVQDGTPERTTVAEGRRLASDGDETVLPHSFASRIGVGVGDKVTVSTPTGLHDLKVVGTFRLPEQDGDGGFLRVPLATAQRLGGAGDDLRGIDIELDRAVDRDLWMAAHRDALGPGLEMTVPEGADDSLESFLVTVQGGLTFMAAIALFVGAFLIYLTLSTAVIERTRTYGTLRALGATRKQVRDTVLREAAVMGSVSTAAGLVLGLGISVALVAVVSSLFDLANPPLTVTPVSLAVGAVAGVLTTVVAALVPARRAARLSPVEAMRGDPSSDARLGRSWIVGLVSLAIGLAVSAAGARSAGTTNPILAMGSLFVLLAAVLLVPVVLSPVAGALGRLTGSASPGVGPVAVMHLVKERSRSAYTLGLVMVVLAMTFTMAAASASMHRALEHAVAVQWGADLFVEAQGTIPDLEQRVAAVPGVAATTAISYGRIQWSPEGTVMPVSLTVVDPATYFDISGFVWVDGSDEEASRALAAGGAVLVPDRSVQMHGLEVGDVVPIRTKQGERGFTIAGVFGGFSTNETLVVSRGDGAALFGTDAIGDVGVEAEEGTSVATLAEAIRNGPGRDLPVSIETGAQMKAEIEEELDGFFNVFWAILLVAGIVGLLGLTNTLAMSVLQRSREIGVLRAVGTTRRQIRSMVGVEAATLVLVAVVLSVPLGALLSYSFVKTMSAQLGFTVVYAYPFTWVPLLGVFGLAIGLAAAVGPARRASRLQVVQALATE